MFNSKQKQLFEIGSKQPTSESKSTNAFVATAMKESAKTVSGNGALKYSSTGNDFVDQFGKLGSYKAPRSYQEIANDMAILWANNPLLTVCFVFFIRCITRVVTLFDNTKTESVQRGSGLKHEGIMRMMWISINHPNTFWKNIGLFISVGSWKDIITMLSYDVQYNGWKGRVLNWESFGKLILAGLENPNTSELIKKYLPQIKANNKCTTIESQADNIISKWICSLLFGGKTSEDSYKNYKKYRQLKSAGTAHQWQQLISRSEHDLVDFNTVHGRALSLLVSGKYLANQGLEAKYEEWIANKPIAKFTGYVHELASKINNNLKKYQIDTINAQYNQLLSLVGEIDSNFIVVKDTSGSMDYEANGTKMSSYTVAKAMSIFFANMLKGAFHNSYIDFSSTSILRQVKGSNFVENWNTETRVQSADTEVLSVARLLVKVFQSGVPESEFPTGLIFLSDGEFNASGLNYKTSCENFKLILLQNGLSQEYVNNLKFVFWDIYNSFYGSRFNNAKFESYGPAENVFYFGGYDPSVISFLTGVKSEDGKVKPVPTNAEELFQAAMDQQVMKMIEI